MWNEENWKQFLSNNCGNYTVEHINSDANFLAEQGLGPSEFDSLVDVFDREGLNSLKYFPSFTYGNLFRLIKGLKGYLVKESVPNTSALSAEYSAAPPLKKVRLDHSASNFNWFNQVKTYMLYFMRGGEEENFPRRCACAVSPTIAITFAHGRNQDYNSRISRKGNVIRQGTTLILHSLYNGQDQVKAEVVMINQSVDFILLEALDGKTFFDGNLLETILEDPVTSMRLLAIGLSSNSPSQESVTTGVVLSIGPFDDDQMISDIIAWSGDSGGGLFSINNKLLGIVTASLESTDGEYTRTYFAPATKIRAAWEKHMVQSGKKARPTRRSE